MNRNVNSQHLDPRNITMNITKKPKVKFDSTMNSTRSTIVTKSISSTEHKFLQIERDILYSKYLEAEFLKRYLRKKNKQIEQSWDEQIAQKHKEIQNQQDEIYKMQEKNKQVPVYTEFLKNVVFLNEFLTKQLETLNMNTKQVEKLLFQLQNICDKVYMEGLLINQGDQEKLEPVIKNLIELINEIKESTNSDYCELFDKIRQIDELSKQIYEIQFEVGKEISKNNELVLKACFLG